MLNFNVMGNVLQPSALLFGETITTLDVPLQNTTVLFRHCMHLPSLESFSFKMSSVASFLTSEVHSIPSGAENKQTPIEQLFSSLIKHAWLY